MKQRRSETASGERPEAASGSARVPEEMRLNRYLSAAGVCSRREADRIIGEGRVRVNGIPASLGMVIREEDRVFVDGKLVQPTKREIFLAVNKPAGVISATEGRDTTVIDLIDENIKGPADCIVETRSENE